MMENASVLRRRRTPYIHCIHLFDRSISTHFIHLIDRSKESFWQTIPRYGGSGGFRACAVEQRRWRREEEADVEATAEETSSSGVDGSGVESGRDLESFGMKSKMTRGGLLFICSKILAAVLN
jgi:hypothetical protein